MKTKYTVMNKWAGTTFSADVLHTDIASEAIAMLEKCAEGSFIRNNHLGYVGYERTYKGETEKLANLS